MGPIVVNDELIQKLQELAKLDLDIKEREKLKQSLQEMIGMFDLVMDDGHQSNVSGHLIDNKTVLRKDESMAMERDFIEKGQGIHFKNQYFSVPKVKKS